MPFPAKVKRCTESLQAPSPSPSVPPLPKGEALACRVTFHWTPEARYGAKGRALLQRAAASGQAHLVKLLLAWTAEHYRSRDIVLCSSRRKLTDMPMAPPLGELANEVRLRGQGCCQTALHCDSIALTKSLLIAAQRLFRAGLALSVCCADTSPKGRGFGIPEGSKTPFRRLLLREGRVI